MTMISSELIHNPELRTQLEIWCREALSLITAALAGPSNLPVAPARRIRIRDTTSFEEEYVTYVDWFKLAYANEEAINRLPSYVRALELMKADQLIARHLDTLVGLGTGWSRLDVAQCLRSLLVSMLSRTQSTVFQPATFDSLFRALEQFFYTDTLTYRCLAPLEGFSMEAEILQLMATLAIIHIPVPEREAILAEEIHWGSYPLRALPIDAYGLQCYVEVEKTFGEPTDIATEPLVHNIARTQLDSVCTALRLFKRGAVGFHNIRMVPTFWHPFLGRETTGLSQPTALWGSWYALSSDEIEPFLAFWHSYQRASDARRPQIDVARRRFEFSYERSRPEDKLIDCLIGFEALLLTQEERAELEYRLALRGATLLSDTAEQRLSIFNDLKLAYRERSKIVHGAETKGSLKIAGKDVSLTDFADRVEEHLRSAIKKMLTLCQHRTEKQVLADLSQRILLGPLRASDHTS